MIKFFCEICNENKPVIFCDITQNDLNQEPWGDILCGDCRQVIATITSEKEGKVSMTIETKQ